MVPGPSAASSTAERVPTTDVSISDRMLPPDTGCLSVGEARNNNKAVLQEGRCEQYPVVILGYYSVSV